MAFPHIDAYLLQRSLSTLEWDCHFVSREPHHRGVSGDACCDKTHHNCTGSEATCRSPSPILVCCRCAAVRTPVSLQIQEWPQLTWENQPTSPPIKISHGKEAVYSHFENKLHKSDILVYINCVLFKQFTKKVPTVELESTPNTLKAYRSGQLSYAGIVLPIILLYLLVTCGVVFI